MNPITLPWKIYMYYRNLLTGAELKAYNIIKDSLKTWKSRCVLPGINDADRAFNIYCMVLNDLPMFYHVRSRCRIIKLGSIVSLSFDYIMSESEYDSYYSRIVNFTRHAYDKVKDGKSGSIVLAMHDAICSHVEYFGCELDASHSIIGTMLEKKAVCESIAKTMKACCDIAGIPCIVVIGAGAENEIELATVKEQVNHAWNMVKVKDIWLNLDVTWDLCGYDGDSRMQSYAYYLRSDEVFNKTHRQQYDFYPKCNYDFNYYRTGDRFVKNIKELSRLLNRQRAEMKNISFEYDTVSGYTYQKALNDIRILLPLRGVLSFTARDIPSAHIAIISW